MQLLGTELMMELIGDADGVAAPRLAQLRPDAGRGRRRCTASCAPCSCSSPTPATPTVTCRPYNVLVHDGRLVLIDLPQAVDLVGNPQGFDYLRRDCRNICSWFQARGVDADPDDLRRRARRRAAQALSSLVDLRAADG